MNQRVIKELLFKGYFSAGKFKSPRINYFPLYPDNRLVFSRVKKLKVVAEELAKLIKPLKPDLIASREAAGVPFGVAVALKLNKNFLYLRKEPKGYNTNNVIEGAYRPGQSVMVVDDAISTGNDKKKIIEVLESAGLKVIGVALALDAYYGPKYRRHQAWLRQSKKYKFIRLLTWPELMDYAAKQKFLGRELSDLIIEMLHDPAAWQAKPGNWQKFKKLAAKEKNLVFASSFKNI